jgi:hypothetical protein
MLEVIGAGTSAAANAVDFSAVYTSSDLCTRNSAKIESMCISATGIAPSEVLQEEGARHFPALDNASGGTTMDLSKFNTPVITEARWLFTRAFLSYWRSPTYNVTRFIVNVAIALIFASAYANQKYHTDVAVIARTGVIFITCLFCGTVGMVTVLPVSFDERPAFYREQQSMMYRVGVYTFAYSFVEVRLFLNQKLRDLIYKSINESMLVLILICDDSILLILICDSVLLILICDSILLVLICDSVLLILICDSILLILICDDAILLVLICDDAILLVLICDDAILLVLICYDSILSSVSQLPYLVVSSGLFTLPFFFIVGFQGQGNVAVKFFWYWLFQGLYGAVLVCMGQFYAALMPSQESAQGEIVDSIGEHLSLTCRCNRITALLEIALKYAVCQYIEIIVS